MRKLLQFLAILVLGVFCCACVNTFAIQELNEKAQAYMEQGDIESALARLEASIDLGGDVYETRYNTGTAYIQIGKCDKAIKHLQAATTLKPEEPIAFYSLGVAGNCAATNIYETKNEYGKTVPKIYTYQRDIEKARDDYNNYMNISVQAFENYLKIVPNAEDSSRVNEIIKESTQKLQNLNKQ